MHPIDEQLKQALELDDWRDSRNSRVNRRRPESEVSQGSPQGDSVGPNDESAGRVEFGSTDSLVNPKRP